MKNLDYSKIFIKEACPTSIGGQAIMDGVMMQGTDRTAIAMRLPSGELYLKTKRKPAKTKVSNVPVVRGVVAFAKSLINGMGTLMESADILEEYAPEEYAEEPGKVEKWVNDKFGEKAAWNFMMTTAVVMAVVISILFFVILPTWVVNFLGTWIKSSFVLNLFEGILRIAMFVAYVAAIRKMEDINNLFRYHGAEHKSIHCFENGLELTPANADRFYTLHPRCGTSFLVFVLIISLLLFSFLGWPNFAVRILSRLLLIPVIAGLSYELLKWAGRSDGKIVRYLSWPGLMLQKLTTAEPDLDQLEVGLLALKAVLVDPETPEIEGFVDPDGNLLMSTVEEFLEDDEEDEEDDETEDTDDESAEDAEESDVAEESVEDAEEVVEEATPVAEDTEDSETEDSDEPAEEVDDAQDSEETNEDVEASTEEESSEEESEEVADVNDLVRDEDENGEDLLGDLLADELLNEVRKKKEATVEETAPYETLAGAETDDVPALAESFKPIVPEELKAAAAVAKDYVSDKLAQVDWDRKKRELLELKDSLFKKLNWDILPKSEVDNSADDLWAEGSEVMKKKLPDQDIGAIADEDAVRDAIKFLDELDKDGYTIIAPEVSDRTTLAQAVAEQFTEDAKARTLARRYTNDISTVENALRWGQAALGMIENGKNEAIQIMSYATGLTRSALLTRGKELMKAEDFEVFDQRIQARLTGTPLQYILGMTEFMGLPFRVNPSVLIPRLDTEVVVDEALKVLKSKELAHPDVLDMCTGSGAIGVTVASKIPEAYVTMADASEEALHTAMGNAALNGVNQRCVFLHGDMFDAIPEDKRFDMIISNPPYIESKVIETLDVEVKDHEPRMALDGGEDGLDFYRVIADQASSHLKSGGILVLEIGADQAGDVKRLLGKTKTYGEIHKVKDLAGLDRVVIAERL